MKTLRAALTTCAAAACLLAACTEPPSNGGQPGETGDSTETATSGERPHLTIGLTYVPDIQFAPVYLAEANGYFDDAGIDVTLRHHGANEGLFTAAQNGDEDLVIAGGDEMTQAVASGAELQATSTWYQTYPVAFISPADSGIASIEDLPGQTVGVPGEWGETWFALQVALDELGERAQEVSVETIGYTQVAALAAGHVDAVVGFVNNEAVHIPGETTLIQLDDAPLVGISTIATTQSLDDDEAAVAAATEAIERGIAETIADPDSALQAAAAHVPDLDPDNPGAAGEVLSATIPLYGQGDQIGAVDQARWEEMTAFMDQAGLLARTVQADDLLAPLALEP